MEVSRRMHQVRPNTMLSEVLSVMVWLPSPQMQQSAGGERRLFFVLATRKGKQPKVKHGINAFLGTVPTYLPSPLWPPSVNSSNAVHGTLDVLSDLKHGQRRSLGSTT